jgi:hypothetical protein
MQELCALRALITPAYKYTTTITPFSESVHLYDETNKAYVAWIDIQSANVHETSSICIKSPNKKLTCSSGTVYSFNSPVAKDIWEHLSFFTETNGKLELYAHTLPTLILASLGINDRGSTYGYNPITSASGAVLGVVVLRLDRSDGQHQ